jgi:tRNA 2-thiouridine synthesizing protein A
VSEEAITRLDARGLRCPEPVMLLHARIRKLGPGAELEVIATDPTTQRDIAAFCEHLGHQLLESREEHGEYLFRIRKRASV